MGEGEDEPGAPQAKDPETDEALHREHRPPRASPLHGVARPEGLLNNPPRWSIME